MKYTSYKQIKEATEEELKKIDPEDYTDEELMQIQRWLTKASLELIPEDRLIGLNEIDKMLLGLKHSNVIGESMEYTTKDGIIDCCIVKEYPEFSIVQKNGTNDFYRINHK